MRGWVMAVAAALMAAGGDAQELRPAMKDQGDRYSGPAYSSRSAVIAQNGMVATSHPLATQAAIAVLKREGTAVDAAIAANAVLGVVEPVGNGIGGDLFAIVWDPKTKKLYGLNASGRAPAGQSLKQIRRANGGKAQLPPTGWLPITVPGTVDGWFALHAKFGKITMERLLFPAEQYARDGHPVSELIAAYWTRNTAAYETANAASPLPAIENMRSVYKPGGAAPKEGQVFKNPDLAVTLNAIAKGGRDAFYNGPLTDKMDAFFRRIGSPMRKSDFQAQKAEWVEPVSVNYRGHDVWELPPNTQGIAALQMLNLLEGYDLKAMGRGSADFWHVMTEAKKVAYEDRAVFIGDDGKAPVARLLSKDYAAERRKLIDMARAAQSIGAGNASDPARDTIYLTVADKDGMMVSLIQSNYRGMGSGVVPDDGAGKTLGFMFQNRGQQFALQGHAHNLYAPGKRPFHTIIPAFVTKDGKPLMSFGVMGGDMQPQGHVQIVVNMVDFGMNVQQAGDVARFHHGGSSEPDGTPKMADGGKLEIETGVPQAVADELKRRGHNVVYASGPYGGYQAIWRDPESGVYWGASDFRKDGQAAGY
jgi:gamma-glutamyltranspeptidase/glutathione hydrolase